MLSFFPRGVSDEILNLIESISEGFPSYSYIFSTENGSVFTYITQRAFGDTMLIRRQFQVMCPLGMFVN